MIFIRLVLQIAVGNVQLVFVQIIFALAASIFPYLPERMGNMHCTPTHT